MMEAKDWMSFFVGLLVLAFGALPILHSLGVGPTWFDLPKLSVQILSYAVALLGFYLVVNSIIEITNSNSIGWFSFLVAFLIMAIGVLHVLGQFGIVNGFLSMPFLAGSMWIFNVIFVVLGLFLMIACFAMEL